MTSRFLLPPIPSPKLYSGESQYTKGRLENHEKNRQKGARELRVSKAALAWSIVGLIFSSIVLRLVIICFFSEMEMAIMAFPFAVVSFISINKGQGGMRKAAMFMLIASAIIFLIGIFRGTFFS